MSITEEQLDDTVVRIDQEMAAERERAQVRGAGEWERSLRAEAVRWMREATGMTEAEVERDLNEYLSALPAESRVSLESVVFRQRLMSALPDLADEPDQEE
jgi:hypothetical protein